mgnify:CR=1 FL=1
MFFWDAAETDGAVPRFGPKPCEEIATGESEEKVCLYLLMKSRLEEFPLIWCSDKHDKGKKSFAVPPQLSEKEPVGHFV